MIKKEFQLAINSAPPEIRDSTGVFVLEEHGFVKVRDSRNGFNCIVERRARHLSPMCYDSEGSNSTLQATLLRGELLMRGTDPVEIEKRIDEAYRDGRLHAPQKTGIVYMLSTEGDWHDQSSGGVTVHIVPHIMVYAPYLKNSDIAVAKEQVWKTNRVWIQYEGRPDAYLICSGRHMGPTIAALPTRPARGLAGVAFLLMKLKGCKRKLLYSTNSVIQTMCFISKKLKSRVPAAVSCCCRCYTVP